MRKTEYSPRRANLPFLNYLRANADELQCRVIALNMATDVIDYALVDFLGVHLQPQVYETSALLVYREDFVMLFARGALRRSVKHLEYRVS